MVPSRAAARLFSDNVLRSSKAVALTRSSGRSHLTVQIATFQKRNKSRYIDRPNRFTRTPEAGGRNRLSSTNRIVPAPSSVEPPDGLDPQEIQGPSVPLPHQPLDVLQPDSHPGAALLLGQDALIVTRQIEMMNIFLGFEQANKYQLLSPSGQPVGYLAEEETGAMGGAFKRQLLRTHRPFKATVLDLEGNPILRISRPFTVINSRASIYSIEDGEESLVGESQQRWHAWRRKYELFTKRSADAPSDHSSSALDDSDPGSQLATREDSDHTMDQFATIDTGLLGWDFVLQDGDGASLGAINRNFRGFGRELFTDTGQYVLRFHSISAEDLATPTQSRLADPRGDSPTSGLELATTQPSRPLTLDERAVALAAAVSVDFDFFSRQSHTGSGGMFPWIWMGGSGGGGQQQPPPEGEGGDVQRGQDSSGVEAPPPMPGSDGGLGPAVGTGAAYELGQRGWGASDDTPAPPPSGAGAWDSPTQGTGYSEDGWGGQTAGEGGASQQEEVWGSEEPWAEQAQEGGGGLFDGWSLGDFLPGGGD